MRNRTGLPRLTVAAISILGLALAGSAGGDPIPKGKDIDIYLSGNPVRLEKVLPTGKSVCPGKKTEDCENEVTWGLKGKTLPTGWTIEISLKSGATKQCFPNAPFKLTQGKTASSGPIDAKACTDWDVWPYDVILRDEKGTELNRIDPLIVVNR